MCSVHQGDTMSTSGGIMMHVGGHHGYIGGCSVHQGDTMSTLGEIMSTLGDVQIPPPSGVLMISPDVLMVSPDVPNSPHVLNIPRCTEHTLYRV